MTLSSLQGCQTLSIEQTKPSPFLEEHWFIHLILLLCSEEFLHFYPNFTGFYLNHAKVIPLLLIIRPLHRVIGTLLLIAFSHPNSSISYPYFPPLSGPPYGYPDASFSYPNLSFDYPALTLCYLSWLPFGYPDPPLSYPDRSRLSVRAAARGQFGRLLNPRRTYDDTLISSFSPFFSSLRSLLFETRDFSPLLLISFGATMQQ